MESVTTFEILVALYMAVIPPVLGVLFWSRLTRMETTLNQIAATYVPRDEFLAAMSEYRDEFHAAMAESRQDMGNLRSDVTQIALAVGARPRASEG